MNPTPEPPAGIHVSHRGFKHGPPVPAVRGGNVTVYESSAATEPRIWLRVALPEAATVAAELPLDAAAALRDLIDYLITHHYQRDTPPPTEGDRLTGDLTVAVHEATTARAELERLRVDYRILWGITLGRTQEPSPDDATILALAERAQELAELSLPPGRHES